MLCNLFIINQSMIMHAQIELSNLSKNQVQLLATFNDKLMMEEDTSSALIKLRQHIKPNFYGYSAVGLADLAPAILTKLEYELITD